MKEKNIRTRHKYSLKKSVFLSGEKSKKDILNKYNLNESVFNYWIHTIFQQEDLREIMELKNENSKLEEENIFLKNVIRILAEKY